MWQQVFKNNLQSYLFSQFLQKMQSPHEQMHLQLVQSTTVLNRLLNYNCCFDGSVLTHITGSSLAQHNVFQNTKHFAPRATPYTPTATAFHKAADTTTVLVTKSDSRTFLEFYLSDKPPIVIQLHYDLKVYDCLFLQRKRVCILCFDLVNKVPMVMLVSSNRKLTKFQTQTPLIKFLHGDRRLLMLKGQQNCMLKEKTGTFSEDQDIKGCIQFEVETQSIGKEYYKDQAIVDLVSIDQAEIIVTPKNKLQVYIDEKRVQQIDLKEFGGEWGCGTRLSRSLLIAFKGELTLGHFKWFDGKLEWAGRYDYPERLKANIINLEHSADEMNVILATQIYHKDNWTMQFFLFNCGVLSADKKFINAFTRLVPSGSQTGDIVSLQKIVSSQIYFLSGPSIVNYSYIDHIEKKHKYVIHESPRSISVHPLGYQIFCTFQGSVKFYQKVQQELLQIWSQSWSCSAAKYTESGLLLLCVFEEGTHQIILYDPNSFKRIKVYSHLYLKHAVTGIDLDETENEMVLWSAKDLSVYKLKTGEKLSQFRQKKEGFEALCTQYDCNRHLVLVGLKQGLAICKKNQPYHLNFSNQKRINIEENISCILIKENIETAFLGCLDGKILITSYPLKPFEETLFEQTIRKIHYKSIRVHSSPTADILLTNNNKYLFSSSKGEGLAILKIKKNSMGGYYTTFDTSNYNFIETSSKPYLENVQEKLKRLLQKRKAIFNELEQYKKEWESKKQQESKSVNAQHKKKELTAVNSALEDIVRTKAKQQQLLSELKELEILETETLQKKEDDHHSKLLKYYSQNDRLKKKKEEIQRRCALEFNEINSDCASNLKCIQKEIKTKFEDFKENYKVMRHNLLCFTLKGEIQAKQDKILAEQQIEQTRLRLRNQENELYRKNNEIKGEITRNKKELQRFINRKDFLENKQRFFNEELKFCGNEEKELNQIKLELIDQLKELEKDTQKKEKRLRKYFIENQLLLKYQIVHDNLTKTTERQILFEQEEQTTLKHQIHELQKEIISLSDSKTNLHKETSQKHQQVAKSKKQIKDLKMKSQYLELQIKELQRLLATVGPGRQVELQGLYEKFFVDKRLEGAIECPLYKEKQKTETKQQQKKIKEELQAHKDYLVKNMNTFQKVNQKAFEQIHLSYVKYQSQNYALISECNVRKEQISKKKRVLQEMSNSVRETQNYMNQLQTSQPNKIQQINQHKREESQPKLIPFIEYEKQMMKKDKSEPSLMKSRVGVGQVRKMLDIQKFISPDSRVKPARRIQTANIKKKQESGDIVGEEDCGGWMITKPQTASRRRGAQQEARRLFSRNKSNSKPTTATSHSKYSVFI